MRWTLAFFVTAVFVSNGFAQMETPKVSDPRLVVELVAQAPDIVHPISCDFDHKGRLLVIESHTHFAPKDYTGPKFDRIKMFDVAKKSKPTTFFEGTRHTMDLAVHPDGSVYIATRNEILRLRDTKGTGVADEKTRIVFLDTKGDYPHNGLSGLCFDSKGDLIFGMGENLGAFYKLIGADGKTFSGEGDGGHIFHCSADGKKLRRIATGFWNPFGICRDIYGRMFCVDNDPDQAPPCRMVHVVEGGDYGFRFCYGRSGKHPFQSWHGQLPGTLPMMTGVGEAPCEILSYESDGLPAEYRGQLLVTSWADHRVERYAVKPHGASFKADRLPFVQGGNNFRPVGLCTAPDGSLYVTDWVLSNYQLHGKGAIWRIREKDDPSRERKRPVDPKEAILSMHRPLREAAARKLASDPEGHELLHDQLDHKDVRVRATSLQALADQGAIVNFAKIATKDAKIGIRELAVRAILTSQPGLAGFYALKNFPAPIRAEGLRYSPDAKLLTEAMQDKDPFLRHSAIEGVARNHDFAKIVFQRPAIANAQFGESAFLALCRVPPLRTPDSPQWVRGNLADPRETVRFLAVKWIADEKLADYRKDVEKGMQDPKLSVRMYMAYATALARLDGQPVNEKSLADYFAKRLVDDSTPPALRAMLLRQVPATHPKLTVDFLAKALNAEDAGLQLEAVRALVEHPNPKRDVPLLAALRSKQAAEPVRAHALLGLTDRPDLADEFIGMMRDRHIYVRREALRALIDLKLTEKQRELVQSTAANTSPIDLVERATEGKITRTRPPVKDLDGWLTRLEGASDTQEGARVFFHPKLGGCYKCHAIDGRGQDVGPDLSSIGRTDRRHLLESILQPSNTVAPNYVAWHLETADGKVRTGMLLHTQLDEYTYLDAQGARFKLKTGDLVEQRPLTVSIMPDGLVDRMTDQEMRDLLAYLQSRK